MVGGESDEEPSPLQQAIAASLEEVEKPNDNDEKAEKKKTEKKEKPEEKAEEKKPAPRKGGRKRAVEEVSQLQTC